MAAVRFIDRPASPLPLGVLRVGLGLVLLVQAFELAPGLFDVYGSRGLVQAPVVDALVGPWAPRLSWVAAALEPLGLGESTAIRLVFALHLGAAALFTLGWRTRAATILLWLTNLLLTTSATTYTYGVDRFTRIALFYCLFAPVGSALSCDVVAGRASGAPSFAARLSLHVLQVHLAIVYAATGLEKASGIQWWNGEALWRALMRPDLGTLDFSWLAWHPWLAKVGCWTTLVVEIATPSSSGRGGRGDGGPWPRWGSTLGSRSRWASGSSPSP